MKPLSSFVLLSSFLLTACGAPTTVATVPTPAPAVAPAPSAPTAAAAARSTDVPPVALPEAPKNWQLLDQETDKIPGISAERAMKEHLLYLGDVLRMVET